MASDRAGLTEIERCFVSAAAALRAGDFRDLAVISARIESLLQGIGGAAPDRAVLEGLRARADEQMRLLAAARDGVRAAATRVAELRRAPGEMLTYDPAGRGQTLQVPAERIEHRA